MNRANLITFVNTFSYYQLLDSGFPVERLDTIFADGLLQVKLHNFFHKEKINRASFDFSSLADDCLLYAQKNNLKVAMIGAKPEEITEAVKNLRDKYKDLRIVYSRDGYFYSEDERQELCRILKAKRPDIVILGMGTPEQEECALYLSEHGVTCSIITCGGFLTQTARKPDYYRPLIKRFNLRWLQRAIEFKHIRKRLFVDYPKNIARYFIDHMMLLLKTTCKSTIVYHTAGFGKY
jgi:N-acetylglucosaminyldiphosphoundecaprenol N-acetyl-beta-D-mannosaminyltransferase